MTLRHVLTIAGVLLLFCCCGAVITSACRRLWDWREQRAYVPPSVLYTEVDQRPVEADKPAYEEELVQVSPEAREEDQREQPSMWALTQFAKARALADGRAADENLAEFAGRVATEIPVIGCELDMLFTLRRAAVPA